MNSMEKINDAINRMYRKTKAGGRGNFRLLHEAIVRGYLINDRESLKLIEVLEDEIKKVSYDEIIENTSSHAKEALLEVLNTVSVKKTPKDERLTEIPKNKYLLLLEVQKARKIIDKAHY